MAIKTILAHFFAFGIGKEILSSLHPLYGNASLGYYFIEAEVGSSRQRQSLIVDTGSYSTVFGCQECKLCGSHKDPIFDPRNSSLFERVASGEQRAGWRCITSVATNLTSDCQFNQAYLEGSSYSGFYAQDQFLFENETVSEDEASKFTHIFGCATHETNHFFSQPANGIIGLGVRRFQQYNPPTIIELAFAQGRAKSLGFSLCLGLNGGHLRLGAPIPELHLQGTIGRTIESHLRWDDIFSVELSKIAIDNAPVKYNYNPLRENPGKVFFDSGTTFTYFSHELFAQWKLVFDQFCRLKDSHCAGYTEFSQCYDFESKNLTIEDALRTFPNQTFTFNDDLVYTWHAQDYFIFSGSANCIGIKPLKDLILGANFMRNYDLFFNIEEQTVSFARANCSGDHSIWSEAPRETSFRFLLSELKLSIFVAIFLAIRLIL